jgi:hypothetical protein
MFEFEIKLDCENNEIFTKKVYTREKKNYLLLILTKINRLNQRQ